VDAGTSRHSEGGYSIFAGTLADMTWPEVEAAGARNAPLLVPVAVIEQHSRHLPLATDTYGAYLLCSLIRDGLAERGLEVLIAPPCYYGVNATTAVFPGSLNISPETMKAVLTESLENYARWGFRRQFIVNHHGDPQHNRAIVESIQALRAQGVETTYFLGGMIQGFVDAAYQGTFRQPLPLTGDEVLRSPESETTREATSRLTRSAGLDVHAGERETSLIMRWFPKTLAEGFDIRELRPVPDTARQFQEAEATGRWRELSPWGHIGDPAVATPENGELYALEAADMATALAEFLRRRG
jgi:creatinine amidohydrolase